MKRVEKLKTSMTITTTFISSLRLFSYQYWKKIFLALCLIRNFFQHSPSEQNSNEIDGSVLEQSGVLGCPTVAELFPSWSFRTLSLLLKAFSAAYNHLNYSFLPVSSIQKPSELLLKQENTSSGCVMVIFVLWEHRGTLFSTVSFSNQL